MKKRILSALLAAGMMLALAACPPQTHQEMLESAAAKTNALSSAEYAVAMSAQMDMGGIQLGMDIDQSLKMVNDQENPQVEAVVSMDLFGESVEAHTIYQDGWCYVDTMGSKMKYAADYDEFLATQGENLLDASGTPTDFSSLEDVSITQDGDNRVISFTGGDALIEEIMGAVQDTQGMDITDASGQFTIDKDGYLSGQKFSFSASMDSDGMTGTMDMTIDLTLQNPGAEVTIQVDDPDSYEEVDPSAITDGTEGLVTE